MTKSYGSLWVVWLNFLAYRRRYLPCEKWKRITFFAVYRGGSKKHGRTAFTSHWCILFGLIKRIYLQRIYNVLIPCVIDTPIELSEFFVSISFDVDQNSHEKISKNDMFKRSTIAEFR